KRWRQLIRRLRARSRAGAAQGLDTLPPWLLSRLARWRRARGYSDRLTLQLYRRAWLSARSADSLFDYLAFRRDLGFALPLRYVESLSEAMPRLPRARRRLALALLAEAAPERLAAGAEKFAADLAEA